MPEWGETFFTIENIALHHGVYILFISLIATHIFAAAELFAFFLFLVRFRYRNRNSKLDPILQ